MHKVFVLCFAGLVTSASAIVVNNYATAEAAPPSSPGLDLDWGYVYNYNNSSAVAVDAHWILTAKHVANTDWANSFSSDDGTVYLPQEVIRHPSADLAMVRVDKLLLGHYGLYTGYLPTYTTDTKLPVLIVGYGTTGSVETTYWTTEDGGAAWGRGTKRWGSQQIDVTSTVDNEFTMHFNEGRTAYEAGVGFGDSGGGVFYKTNGVWQLAGINVYIREGTLGFNRAVAVPMPEYSSWVMETIPEPVTLSLMGFSTIGLFLSRAKRRRKLAGRSVFPIGHEPLCDLFGAMEEGDAHLDMVECTNSLTKLTHTLHLTLFPAWIKQFHSRFGGCNKVFWNHMVQVHEHGSAKLDAIKSALMSNAAIGIDSFLDKITCDKMVGAFEARRQSIQSALKRKTIKGLDAFLDKIYWDKVVSAYETRKKAIRSAKEESFRDSYRGES